MNSNGHATNAAFYFYGLEAGIFTETQVRDWAFSIIEQEEDPAAEISELAVSKGFHKVLDALRPIAEHGDVRQAGHRLLKELKRNFADDQSKLKLILKQTLQVVRSAQLSEETWYKFDQIDDEVSLAEQGAYGTIEMCCDDLTEVFRTVCDSET